MHSGQQRGLQTRFMSKNKNIDKASTSEQSDTDPPFYVVTSSSTSWYRRTQDRALRGRTPDYTIKKRSGGQLGQVPGNEQLATWRNSLKRRGYGLHDSQNGSHGGRLKVLATRPMLGHHALSSIWLTILRRSLSFLWLQTHMIQGVSPSISVFGHVSGIRP